MTPVTEGRILAVFAQAPSHRLLFFDDHLDRRSSAALMASIAKWLLR